MRTRRKFAGFKCAQRQFKTCAKIYHKIQVEREIFQIFRLGTTETAWKGKFTKLKCQRISMYRGDCLIVMITKENGDRGSFDNWLIKMYVTYFDLVALQILSMCRQNQQPLIQH